MAAPLKRGFPGGVNLLIEHPQQPEAAIPVSGRTEGKGNRKRKGLNSINKAHKPGEKTETGPACLRFLTLADAMSQPPVSLPEAPPVLKRPLFLLSLVSACASLAAAEIDLSKPVSQTVAPDILYWPFDGGEIGLSRPNPAPDNSGNQLHGEMMGEGTTLRPDYVPGRFGTAISVEGTPRQSPAVKAPPANPGEKSPLDLHDQSFTAGAWVRLREPGLERHHLAVMELPNWNFFAQMRDGIGWYVGLASKHRATATEKVHLEDEEWHHLAFSVEVAAEGTIVTFWLDGNVLGQPQFLAGPIPPFGKPTNFGLRLGRSNLEGSLVIDDAFITSGVHTFRP